MRYSFATQVQLPHATELVDTLAQPAFVLPAQNFSDMHISEVLCNSIFCCIADFPPHILALRINFIDKYK